MRRASPAAALALALGACTTMAPAYERPAAPIPSNLAGGAGTAKAADLPWRQFVREPRLAQVIAQVLSQNRDLRRAALNIQAARAQYHDPGRATYMVMRIVNYTNVCVAQCDYCAFYVLPNQDGGYVLFSDVLKNTIHRWKQGEGAKPYLTPSGYTSSEPRGGETGSNGLTLDHQGHLVLAQHGDRRVARMDAPLSSPQPKFVTLADRPDLNSKYAVFGRVVSGEDVPERLERGDLIRRMFLKE